MRFAYIDSQGKEVGIPSVEALQLRIELGAITEATEFYDANQDRWAPAGEHEIFRTLTRELNERNEGGFVAPPPPSMGGIRWPGEESEESEEGEGSEETEAPDVESDAEGDADVDAAAGESVEEAPKARAPNPFEAGEGPGGVAPLPDDRATPDAADDADGAGDAGDAEEGEESADGGGFDFEGFGDLELTDAEEEAGEVEEVETVEEADEEAASDFSGFGELELEEPEVEETGDAPSPPPESPPEPPAAEDEAPSAFDFGGGLEMEESFADQHGGAADEPEESDSGMELEEPLSDFSGEEPPSWMEEESGGGLELEDAAEASYADSAPSSPGPGGPGEREGAGSAGRTAGGGGGYGGDGSDGDDPGYGGQGEDGGEGEDQSRRKAPRARPAPPPRRSSGVPKAAVAAVVLLVLAGGGWFAWRTVSGGGGTVDDPPVVITEIPTQLDPTLAAAVPPAYQAALDSLRSLSSDLPDSPDDDWLAGVYLANASRYDGIEEYWAAMDDYLDTVRGSEEEIFVAALEQRLDSLGVTGGDRDLLRERARTGFQSARRDRRVVYDQFEGVIRASRDLHDFLLGNEGQIEYEPAGSGLSRDPVREAIPSTETLGVEMWDRVGEITDALDRFGALEVLDRVTTERLLRIVFDKLAETPVH